MIPFVYVMGHGFSGSTLLAFLLGAHPEISTVGEVGIAPTSKARPEEFVCSCGRPLRDCPFWSDVAARMRARGLAFDPVRDELHLREDLGPLAGKLLHAGLRGPLLEAARHLGLALVPRARRELRRFLDRYVAFVDSVREVQGGRVFVDASKYPERAALLARRPELDLRVVHLLRDGRAVACSSMRNRNMSPAEAATSWARDLRRCERVRARLAPDRWLTLRYEDLCRDPAASLERVFRFAGVDPGAGRIADFRAVEQHIVGNRMRLQRTSEIRLDERWREALSEPQRREIESILADDNRRYGYAA